MGSGARSAIAQLLHPGYARVPLRALGDPLPGSPLVPTHFRPTCYHEFLRRIKFCKFIKSLTILYMWAYVMKGVQLAPYARTPAFGDLSQVAKSARSGKLT